MACLEVFWRPPLTSSSQFRKEDRHLAFGLVSRPPGSGGCAGPAISQIAGWLPGEVVKEAVPAGCGLRRQSGTGLGGEAVEVSLSQELVGKVEEPAVFERGADKEVQWTGLLSVEPGSKLRLVGPSSFQLGFGRARGALPRAVLRSSACPPAEDDRVQDFFELRCTGGKGNMTATIEILHPPQGKINSTWVPLCWSCFQQPEKWALVRVLGNWVDGGAGSCDAPAPFRVPLAHLRSRQQTSEAQVRLALLVVLAAQPAESGVGCMTPNWSLAPRSIGV